MRKIILVTDYNDRFGTKYTAIPYRNGMDKGILAKSFSEYGFEPLFIRTSEVLEMIANPSGMLFLYTSSEDSGENYKSFIEDVILALDSAGGIIIPSFKFLRAHNNKVLMELMRKEWGQSTGDILRSQSFGSLEEFDKSEFRLNFPVVVKRPEGFKSRGVYLADNIDDLRKIIKMISRTRNIKGELRDFARTFIHKGFVRESGNRRKFILQNYVPGLEGDFKVLVYGDRYYVLGRKNRQNDFRASGSGILSYPEVLPAGLLDFAERVINYFDVPMISIDIAFNGNSFFVLEAQFLYFGTYTIEHSEFYFKREKDTWKLTKERSVLESEYVRSICTFIKSRGI